MTRLTNTFDDVFTALILLPGLLTGAALFVAQSV